MRSVLECVLEHAEKAPERACVRIFSQRIASEARSYGQIAEAAARGAGFLAAHGVGRGDPVALIGSHHIDMYAAWLGALWIGAVPTVLAEPSVRIDKTVYWSRLATLLERSEVRTLLLAPGIEIASGPAERLRRFTYEELARSTAPAPRQVEVMEGSLIALQHSSGTTGLQKGVMLTHGMVMRNAAAQFDRLGINRDDVTANWLPLFHDLGLINAFILPLISGGSMIWLSPFEWVNAPGMLLEAITRHRATITWLPNFAFGFLAQSVTAPPESFDLTSLRAVLSGGEPATEATMTAFRRRYEAAGLRPDALHVGYGMAEAVGGVAHSSPVDPPRFLTVSKRRWAEEHLAEPADEGEEAIVQVSSGVALAGCELRVVDEERRPVPPRRAGRILLRSSYMFSGYYRRDDLNRDLFDADGFFDTGDVGYLDEAGHVFVTGRRKDLIKVTGRTIYPQDVEDALNAVPGVHPGRAVCFGVPLDTRGTEGLVVLAESDLPEAEWPELVARIRVAVVQATDVDVLDVKVISRNTLRKSTAGKLARDSNRDWYVEGRFGPPPTVVGGRAGALSGVADCAYAVEWRAQPLAEQGASPRPVAGRARSGAWLVVLDERGVGAALAASLRARGEACVEVSRGAGYERIGDQVFRADLTSPAALSRLLGEALDRQPCLGAIHCGALDAASWAETSDATLLADLQRGTLVAVRLAQALARAGLRDTPRLFLVTRGAVVVDGRDAPGSVGQAPLSGLARTIALEHPELECTQIDVHAGSADDEARLLAREIADGDGEDRVALRPGGRFVARLVRSCFAPTAASPAAPADGAYLVTGGLGGLGLSLARALVSQGARELVLLGRRPPTEATRDAVRALEAAGAKVHVLQGDVADRADVDRALAYIASRARLRGVVHAAAAPDDRTLLQLDEETLWSPIRPKVLGAWHLHEATRGQPLDFFALCSCATATLGSAGQANEAAANAFLDALARARTAAGLPATALRWGPVATPGASTLHDTRRRRMSSQGITTFREAEGAALFTCAISGPGDDVMLVRLSARQWFDAHPQASGTRSLVELEREEPPQAGLAGAFRATVERAAPAERGAMVDAYVLDHVARLLGREAAGLDRRAPFMSLGLDSLMSIDLRNRLEVGLGLRLPTTLLFTYPTPADLASYLRQTMDAVEKVEAIETASRPEAAPAATEPAETPQHTDLSGADDDDLLAALDRELALAVKKKRMT